MNRNEFKAKLEEQRLLGFPNFKNRIVEILVNNFNVESSIAKKTVFSSHVESKINKDMIWSQHMGAEFWANAIIENDLLFNSGE